MENVTFTIEGSKANHDWIMMYEDVNGTVYETPIGQISQTVDGYLAVGIYEESILPSLSAAKEYIVTQYQMNMLN